MLLSIKDLKIWKDKFLNVYIFCLLTSFLIPYFPTQKGRRKCLVFNWAWNQRSPSTTRKAVLLIFLANARGGCSRNLAKFSTQLCRLTCEVLSIWKETDKQLSNRFYLNKTQTLKVFGFNKGEIFATHTVLLPDSTDQSEVNLKAGQIPHTRGQTHHRARTGFPRGSMGLVNDSLVTSRLHTRYLTILLYACCAWKHNHEQHDLTSNCNFSFY